MNAEDIRSAMRKNFTPPTQEVVFEVPDDVSGRATRYCDAMVLDMWASRGFELAGFEIKISRSDWTRELSMPNKAEVHFALCDRWWLITPAYRTATAAAAVAKAEEIPGPWGWMAVNEEGKCLTYKKAPKLVPTKKRDWRFALALVRASNRADQKEIARLVSAGVEAQRSDMTARINARAAELVASDSRVADRRHDTVAKIEAAIGGKRWGRLADDAMISAIATLVDAQALLQFADVERHAKDLEDVAGVLRKAAGAIKTIGEPKRRRP